MELSEVNGSSVKILPGDSGIREKIMRLEAAMLSLPVEAKDDLPTSHHFSKGVYAREIRIPKGCLLVGLIHKYPNLNIISQGDISVLTEDGVVRIKAPYTMVAPAGTKRVGFTHEETVWTTIHGTYELDLDSIESEFIARDFGEVLGAIDIPTLGGE